MDLPENETTHPKLHLWLRRRSISSEAFGGRVGVTRQAVDLWRLPFGHRRRARPDDERLAAIVRETSGEVTAEDFYPHHLRSPKAEARPGDDRVLAAGRAS
jgi:hypothetical protein